jgi:DNA-binding NarL/FixJ family response regulator
MTDRHKSVSVILADDHPAILLGVAELLRSKPDIKVVATCSDGTAAMQAIRQLVPMVAVLDFFMPGLNGLEVLGNICAERIVTRTVFLTATATDKQVLTAVSRGAKGIVLKEMALDELVQCIRIVAGGREWLPPGLIDGVFERETARQSVSAHLAQSLTCREREIVLLVAEGLSNKEMCRRLGLSEGTVKIHLHNVYEKVGVNNRTALAAMAVASREELILSTGNIRQEISYPLCRMGDNN